MRRHLFASLLSLTTTASAAGLRPLQISIPDWPPYYIEGVKTVGQRGLATEVLARCTERLGLAYTFTDEPINRMFKSMEKGDLDLNIMSFKADRTHFLVYGKEAVFRSSYVPFVKGNANISIRDEKDFDRWRVGDMVGMRLSDSFRKYLDARLALGDKGRVDVVNSAESLVKMLVKGRIDVAVAAKAELPWRAKNLGYSPKVIKALPYTIKSADYYFVLAKNSPYHRARPQLMAEYDRCISDMRRDGSYDRLARANGIMD